MIGWMESKVCYGCVKAAGMTLELLKKIVELFCG